MKGSKSKFPFLITERNHCVVVIKTAALLREPTLDFRRRYWLDKRRQIQSALQIFTELKFRGDKSVISCRAVTFSEHGPGRHVFLDGNRETMFGADVGSYNYIRTLWKSARNHRYSTFQAPSSLREQLSNPKLGH